MSSAMDLQIKLANDGYAKNIQIKSRRNAELSIWQNKVIGFSLELPFQKKT